MTETGAIMRQLQKNPVRRGRPLAAAALLASALAAGGYVAGASASGYSGAILTGGRAASYEGAPVPIGNGFARTVVESDATGKPTSIAVMLSREALHGLPETLNSDNPVGAWQYPLPMPQAGPGTGFKTIVIDWNPNGHLPPHIYDVPHFDFHFYVMEAASIAGVTFTGPEDPAAEVTDRALIPGDYRVIPETAVNRMGVHAIDTTAPEFHGKPFTVTFIYGYYNGGLIFVEPMITRDFLLTNQDFVAPVKTPVQISRSGHYPTELSVRYDAARQASLVSLAGLQDRTVLFGSAP